MDEWVCKGSDQRDMGTQRVLVLTTFLNISSPGTKTGDLSSSVALLKPRIFEYPGLESNIGDITYTDASQVADIKDQILSSMSLLSSLKLAFLSHPTAITQIMETTRELTPYHL